jgi:hypothetical protein
MQKYCYFKFVIIKESVDTVVSVDCTYVIMLYITSCFILK